MSDEESDGRTLMVPALPVARGDLVQVSLRPAARDHLAAWDATQRLEAIHESGHACAAAALGIAVQAVDITSRAGGDVQTASPLDDTSVPWETGGRMLDNIVVALAGSAAERVIIGEHTTGGESDNDRAVMIALRWCKAGFAGPDIFIGEDGLGFTYLTDETKGRTIARVHEVISKSRAAPSRASTRLFRSRGRALTA